MNDNPDEQELQDENNTDQETNSNEEVNGAENVEGTETQIPEPAEDDDPLTKLQYEHADMKNKYLRLFAEFDNFKKRTARERIDLMSVAGKDVIKKILPVLDDFKRAIKTNEAEDEAHHNEGFGMIYRKLLKVLEDRGVKQMDCMGEKFDPEFHEAMAELDAPTPEQVGHILDIVEDGYIMNDKIIRYARVVVGK